MKIYDLPFTVYRIFDNMKFVYKQVEIRQKLYDIKQEFKPDIIFSPNKSSFHPDHQVLGESCLNVFQEQTVLFYETARGDYNHMPNLYNKVTADDVLVKQQALMQYRTQTKRAYMTSRIIESQMIFRGSQCLSYLAESFEVGRIIL